MIANATKVGLVKNAVNQNTNVTSNTQIIVTFAMDTENVLVQTIVNVVGGGRDLIAVKNVNVNVLVTIILTITHVTDMEIVLIMIVVVAKMDGMERNVIKDQECATVIHIIIHMCVANTGDVHTNNIVNVIMDIMVINVKLTVQEDVFTIEHAMDYIRVIQRFAMVTEIAHTKTNVYAIFCIVEGGVKD